MTGPRRIRTAARAAATVGLLTRELVARLRDRAAPAAARADALSRVFARVAHLHRLSIDLAGEVPRRPCVLVANHLSYLDALVLLPLVPALPICKGEVGGWPLIGPGARATGVLLVDRACPSSRVSALRGAIAALRGGASVLNFPEGTTTAGDRVLPFHRGIFGAARRAEVPIVPIAIAYADPACAWIGDQTLVPHYLRTAAADRIDVRVAIGEPMWPGRRRAEALAEEARQRIESLLEGSHHVARERVRVPETRPDPVLSAAVG